ncbi:hypothetical protein [Leadbetterella byssophila]|uniref:hypothetical protein n=1 Tax=Leadbetterella byssophila TaxID=316068 RepID=UPI0039A29962
MKLLLPLMVLSWNLYAQNPQFIEPLKSDKAVACSGETVIFSAKVSSALQAYFLKENPITGEWDTLTIIQHPEPIISFPITSSEGDLNIRILLKGQNGQNVLGDPHTVLIRKLSPSIQPQDQALCNGTNATFIAEIPQATSFQWESSTGGEFSPIVNGGKFSGALSPTLKVTGLINAHDGLLFRLKAMDEYGCEAWTSVARLKVHQLSTSVSPTTSKPFCEGDSVLFYPATVGEDALSFQWWMRAGTANYQIIQDSIRFKGIQEKILLVKNIQTNETAFRVRVGFPSISFNGSKFDTTVCYLESSRTNYIIHPRPEKPHSLDTLSHCGPEKFLIQTEQSMYWTTDTLKGDLYGPTTAFTTDTLNEPTTYYYRTKNEEGCYSPWNYFPIIIHPEPVLSLSPISPICPETEYIRLEFEEFENNPNLLFFRHPTQDWDSLLVQENMYLALPKLEESAQLKYWSTNAHCYSDTLAFDIKVLPASKITQELSALSVCQGDTLHLSSTYSGEGTLTWYKDQVLTLPQFIAEESAGYSAVLEGTCGKDSALIWKVQVHEKPIIELDDQSVCAGDTAIFKIKGDTSLILSYRWMVDGVEVAENHSQLFLPTENLSNATIQCEVRTETCTVLSHIALLHVIPKPIPPQLSDTLVVCEELPNLQDVVWLNLKGEASVKPEEIKYVKSYNEEGCSSLTKPITIVKQSHPSIYPHLTSTQICGEGSYNRKSYLSIYSNLPTEYRLYHEGIKVSENTQGEFEITEKGEYTVQSIAGACIQNDTFSITEVKMNFMIPEITIKPWSCEGWEIKASGIEEDVFWWQNDEVIGQNNSITIHQGKQALFLTRGKEIEGLFCLTDPFPIELPYREFEKPILNIVETSCEKGYKLSLNPNFFYENLNISHMYFSPGNYQLKYQDSTGCKFDTLIQIPEYPLPQIISQPSSLVVCEGNIATFQLQTTANVQWEMWSNGKFENIDGETQNRLRIGSTPGSLHHSLYRAKVYQNDCYIYSDTVELSVNQVNGSNTQVSLCPEEAFTPPIPDIIGEIQQIQWQYRPGTTGSFSTLENQELPINEPGYYRARIVFTSNCVITGPTTRISYVTSQIPEIIGPEKACIGEEVLLKVKNCTGQIQWWDGSTGIEKYWVANLNDSLWVTCKSSACTFYSEPYKPTIQFISDNIMTVTGLEEKYCQGTSVHLNIEGCSEEVVWSDDYRGSLRVWEAEISKTLEIRCGDNTCTPPLAIQIKVIPKPDPGEIQITASSQCAGYNPGNIANTKMPVAETYQWQMSAENDTWFDIQGETNIVLNPPALQTTTYYRRVAINQCGQQTSNHVKFEILPDPQILWKHIPETVCAEENISLEVEINGGVAPCEVSWEAWDGSWANMFVGEKWIIPPFNQDTTIRVRAVYRCEKSSCNNASTSAKEIKVVSAPTVKRMTVCEGTILKLDDCLHSEMELTLIAKQDTIFYATCPTFCGSKSVRYEITVVPKPSLPVNLTHEFQLDSAIFIAKGDSLIWFTSATSTTALSTPPIRSILGKHTLYVANYRNGCSSDRLKIETTVVRPLIISRTDFTFTACEGKSAEFDPQIEGAISYVWERKRPSDSVFEIFSEQKTLKISRAGNNESPEGTIYRGKFSNGIDVIVIEEIPLKLNEFIGSLANRTICRGKELALSISNQIKGNIKEFNWENRAGTGSEWEKYSSEEILQYNPPSNINNTQFRCVLYFEEGCSITTDLMTLKIGEVPTKPEDIELQYCLNEKPAKLNIQAPNNWKIKWLEWKPDISTDQAITYSYPFSYEGPEGCTSEKAFLHIIVKDLPGFPFNTTPPSARGSITFSAEGKDLIWYSSMSTKNGQTYPPTFTTNGKKRYYVTQTDGCESERLLIESEVLPAFTITSQPQDMANCEGNTSTFRVRASGGSGIQYQWQIWVDSLYQDIADATLQDLRISPVTESIKVRCRLILDGDTLYSQTAGLFVNKALSTPKEISLCENALHDFSFIPYEGKVADFEWQIRNGSSYSTIAEPQSQGTFRVRITFESGCIRYTDPFQVSIKEIKEISITDTLCPYNDIAEWLLENDLTLIDSIPPLVVQNLNSDFRAKNIDGCTVEIRNFSPQLRTVPSVKDTSINLHIVEKFVDSLWIYWNEKWANNIPMDSSHTYIYKIKSDNACFTDTARIHISTAIPYLLANVDTLFTQFQHNNTYLATFDGKVFGKSVNKPDSIKIELKIQGPFTRQIYVQNTKPSALTLYFHRMEITSGSQLYFSTDQNTWDIINGTLDSVNAEILGISFTAAETGWYRLASLANTSLLPNEDNATTLLINGEEENIENQKSTNATFWPNSPESNLPVTEHESKEKYYSIRYGDSELQRIEIPQRECILIGYPITDRFYLKWQEIQTLEIWDAVGRSIPLSWSTSKKDEIEVRIKKTVPSGQYLVKASNQKGQVCMKKIWINP